VKKLSGILQHKKSTIKAHITMKTSDMNVKQVGRPTKLPEHKQARPVRVMLTNKQAEQLAMQAEQQGVSVSTYIRLKLNIK
jgi:predicted HicB family RNase H-like nuclease